MNTSGMELKSLGVSGPRAMLPLDGLALLAGSITAYALIGGR